MIFSNSKNSLAWLKTGIQNFIEMGKLVEEFNAYRTKMNEKILASDNKVMKRIYSLDTLTYQEGALTAFLP